MTYPKIVFCLFLCGAMLMWPALAWTSEKIQNRDTDNDGQMDTYRFFDQGIIVQQKKDMDPDDWFENVIDFKDGKPFGQVKDTNADKEFDIHIRFKGFLTLTPSLILL